MKKIILFLKGLFVIPKVILTSDTLTSSLVANFTLFCALLLSTAGMSLLYSSFWSCLITWGILAILGNIFYYSKKIEKWANDREFRFIK